MMLGLREKLIKLLVLVKNYFKKFITVVKKLFVGKVIVELFLSILETA